MSQKTALFIATAVETPSLTAVIEVFFLGDQTNKQTKTQWPLVHKRTLPTERLPLVGDI
jgi:hypothetical protein